MLSSLFLSSAVAISLCSLAQAGISIHPACPGYIGDHLKDAIEMSRVAAEAVGKKTVRDAGDSKSNGLYQVLFDEADRSKIQSTYDKISKLSSTTFEVRIYCNEDTIHWPSNADKNTDTTGKFYSSDFHDANGKEVTEWVRNSNTALPRKSLCEKGGIAAYVLNGLDLGNPKLTNQVHVILCPSRVSIGGGEQRLISEIRKNGINSKYNTLDSIHPISATILHELTHTTAVSGTIDAHGKVGLATVRDGNGSYGFEKCRELRKKDSRAPANNAASYALLGTALSLQFQDKSKDFSWVTGTIANVGDKRDTLDESEGLGIGWRKFSA